MHVGRHRRTVANRTSQVDFEIEEKPIELTSVRIVAPKIRQTGDTIIYSVDAFKDQNDRVIGDVLKKLPGIEVSPLGQIKYQGEAINKFYIEGMDLLQGRYGIAVNNIAAKDVASVEVLENHQPVRVLRKRVFSHKAAINLKLKDSARGTLAVAGMAGLGYQPLMWNAELLGMYFAKKMQHMSTYKSTNSGKNISSEFEKMYDNEQVRIESGSLLYVQSPGVPSIAQKRYLFNNSHAATVNQLVKLGKDKELTANALYYTDRIERTGYSLYEQYLPVDSTFFIEEQISTLSKIHNAELALQFNINSDNFYLNNQLNLKGSWNTDDGLCTTRSNAGNLDRTSSQWLNKPFLGFDNTFNMTKNLKNNIYQLYFSTGYGERAHTLTVAPAVDYFTDSKASSLTQDIFLRDFSSELRTSYGWQSGNFSMNYDVFGSASVQLFDTELQLGSDYQTTSTVDSLKNNLLYNNYRTGIHQTYVYKSGKYRLTLILPFTYEIKTADDRIPEKYSRSTGLVFNPSISGYYDFTSNFKITANSNFNRSFGNMNTVYTGYILHSYRSLMRNTIDRLFEIRSAMVNTSISYRNVFAALFLTAGINYRYSWRSLLYGYDYQGVMSVRSTLDQPSISNGFGINFDGSKGLNFWLATARLSGGYSLNKGDQLIQGEILHNRSHVYRLGAGMNATPFKYFGFDYSFSWNRSRSYAVEQAKRFAPLTGISQNGKIKFFPVKILTANFGMEHSYNSAASVLHTVFADGGITFKRNKLDMELEINNIFNSKQYVSASISDVSAYYYSYNLRPLSILMSVRFKLK